MHNQLKTENTRIVNNTENFISIEGDIKDFTSLFGSDWILCFIRKKILPFKTIKHKS